jgi:hypothetical protein
MGRIITREDGQKFHVGGRLVPKKPHELLLHAPKYGLNLSQWPVTPPSTNYGQASSAQACLTDILRNDALGCCTEADQYHRQALRQAAAGLPVFHPTGDQVVATYSRDGGYVPGNSATDQGCDETVVLGNAVTQGITNGSGIYRPAGFVAIDATNRDLVRAVASMFVGASICMGLPDAWVEPFPSGPGWTWKVVSGGSDPNNGHCFTLGDQTDAELGIWSWGMPGFLDYDALAAYATVYIEVDTDILSAAADAAPDGLDWACLMADFQDAGGTIVNASVPPPPAATSSARTRRTPTPPAPRGIPVLGAPTKIRP